MLKNMIKSVLRKCGYRLVPAEIDAKSIYKFLRARDFRTIIDIGAHTGKTVENWLAEFPNSHVHAFEPSPASFAGLKEVADRHPGRVSAWNFAVGMRDECATFHFHEDHTSSSSLLPRTDFCAEVMPNTTKEVPMSVEVKRLDSVLADGEIALQEPILIKIDVQGFEDKVLGGAPTVLTKTEFVISEISTAAVYKDQCDFAKLHAILTANGFSFFAFAEQFHLPDGTPVYSDVVYRRDKKQDSLTAKNEH